MLILYNIIFFFILIFNVLFPLIIKKLTVQKQIIDSAKGKNMQKMTCSNNQWMYIESKVSGLEINYFVDNNGNPLTCDKAITEYSEIKKCGNSGEYNNRYGNCFVLLSELLFYRSL